MKKPNAMLKPQPASTHEEVSTSNTTVSTWFERDRTYVGLECDGHTLVEFWDEHVNEMVEDGFLDPKNWHGSLVEYFNSLLNS